MADGRFHLFHVSSNIKMEGYYSNFSSLMRAHLPEVSAHLEGLGLRPDMYLIDWIMTLYGRAAPLDLACR